MATPNRTEGAWHSDRLKDWASAVAHVPGDFAEIGVFKGRSFQHLAKLAMHYGRTAHAFDSFRGMADPGPRDGAKYPRGKFDIGGVRAFSDFLRAAQVPSASYEVHAGYVPAVFRGCDHISLALAIVDLDHYQPTVDAIAWAWSRLNIDGYLCLDDYFPGRDTYASAAIDEFLAGPGRQAAVVYHHAAQIVVRR